ncbi:MAG: ABC transporter permease [Acidobacteria bacterium]|nr:ABC transporter permease [Acidobacteriota bacterium]
MADISSLIKLAVRSHLRQPGFALVVILTLGVGVGAAVSAFSVLYGTLFQPLPFEDSEQIVAVVSAQPKRQAVRLSVSYPDFKDWQQLNNVFSEMAAVSNTRPVSWTGGDRPEHLQAEFVSWNYFPMLGVGASLGRTFEAEEDLDAGSHPVTVISQKLWQQRFASDPDIVGKTMILNGLTHTIIGVLDDTYRGFWWDDIDLWLPMAMAPNFLGSDYLENRRTHWHQTVARLKPGVTLEQARDEMNSIAAELEQRFPDSNEGYRVSIFSQRELYYGHLEDSLWRALQFSGIFFLLCCLNISSLMLTRGTVRRQEVAVRSALGAGRLRLLTEHLVEGLVLAVAGGLLGLPVAWWASAALLRFGAVPPVSFSYSFFDARVYAVAFGAVILAGLLVGLAPALQTLFSDLWRFLKQGAKTTGSRRFQLLLDGLVVFELAMATTVIVSALVTVSSFARISRPEVGMASDELLTMRVDMQGERYATPTALSSAQNELLEQIDAMSEVEAAAFVGPHAPPMAFLYTDATFEDLLDEAPDAASLRVYREYVTPGYFHAVGIPLLEGREFDQLDTADRPLVVIISKVLADAVWPDQSPIGRRLRRGLPTDDRPWMTVVGVAQTTRNRGIKDFGKGPDYDIYMPMAQDSVPTPQLMVRTEADPVSLAPQIRDLIQRFDSEIPVYDVQTMSHRLFELALDERFLAVLLGIFGALAAVVVAVGIYGVLAYRVRQRLREFGVRMALGATGAKVLQLVLRRGLVLMGLGIGLGLVVTVLLGDHLPGVQTFAAARSPWVLGSTVLFLGVVALIGVLVPAWRATKVSPESVLRQE